MTGIKSKYTIKITVPDTPLSIMRTKSGLLILLNRLNIIGIILS